MLVCSVGDLLLDVVVRLDDPIALDTDTYGETRLAPGGQAANVAAWAVELGARGRVIAVRAADEAGELLARELERRGVELAGPALSGRSGTVVSIATPDGARTMLTDRGVASLLDARDLDPSWTDGCDWLHVSGYALVADPQRGATIELARRARAGGARVAIDLGSTGSLAAGGAGLTAAVGQLAPDILFGTSAELDALPGATAPTVVRKLGAQGVVVDTAVGRTTHAALPAAVIDATGAGDALAAGFLVGGIALGLAAAARCVAQVGAVPPAAATPASAPDRAFG